MAALCYWNLWMACLLALLAFQNPDEGTKWKRGKFVMNIYLILPARIKALHVACSVAQLPKMVVSPRTCTPGNWNAIMIATLSSGIRA